MSPVDFEQQVFDLEGVRIVVRAPLGAAMPVYPYSRKAAGTASINEWLDQRIFPHVGGHPVVVVDGSGVYPHRRTRMSTLRDSYYVPA